MSRSPLSKSPAGHHSSCTCPAHPLPASMQVGEALGHYLAENGFDTSGYTSERSQGSLFGLKFSVPNPPAHQRALRLHDLAHVATGFGTDHAGEAEISVWQARHGLHAGGHYVAAIVLTNVTIGLLAAPRRTLRAVLERSPGRSLFDLPRSYEELLELSVGQLRELLFLPTWGLARGPRGLHAHAPAVPVTSR
jgi:hypothetical protein